MQKYDDVLVPFVALMRKELHANVDKGDRPGWLAMSPSQGLLEIYWHTAKLSVAVKDDEPAAIREHAADVANMAMMLLDVCVGLVVEPFEAAGAAQPVAPSQVPVGQVEQAVPGEKWVRWLYPLQDAPVGARLYFAPPPSVPQEPVAPSQPERMEWILQEVLEFLEDHADVKDGPDGEQVPNRAMTLAAALREVLK